MFHEGYVLTYEGKRKCPKRWAVATNTTPEAWKPTHPVCTHLPVHQLSCLQPCPDLPFYSFPWSQSAHSCHQHFISSAQKCLLCLLYPCPANSCYISTVQRIPTLANHTKTWLLLLFVSFNIGSICIIFILSFCLNYTKNSAVLLASGTYRGHCHKNCFETKYWVFSWLLEAGSVVWIINFSLLILRMGILRILRMEKGIHHFSYPWMYILQAGRASPVPC